jgi:cadmium resistance protein CadD (predicted permease)
MNKITFVILTVVVTFFTGFLGLIPMLIIGFNMYGKPKEKKAKKPLITKKWHVWVFTCCVGAATFAQTDLASAMVNGGLAGFVYWWTNERYKKNTQN